jgi:hypothetical protein
MIMRLALDSGLSVRYATITSNVLEDCLCYKGVCFSSEIETANKKRDRNIAGASRR